MAKKSTNTECKPCRSGWLFPKPLVGQNVQQREYINCINESPIIIAIGYPGTGKTYIPARMAANMLKSGTINNITLVRPNVTASKSVGYYPGTKNEKMAQWLAPVLGALKEEFTLGCINGMTSPERDQVTMCPLELIKGLSLNDSFVIVDEAEDLTIKEVKAVLTRIGTNSKIVLCGDIGQSDLPNSGLKKLIELRSADQRLANLIAFINFNDKCSIVRSTACKEIILGFERAGI